MKHVLEERPPDTNIIDAAVFPEARVFDRDNCVLQIFGDLIVRDKYALLELDLAD